MDLQARFDREIEEHLKERIKKEKDRLEQKERL